MKRNYIAIDILKFLFSVCVVGIHTDILTNEKSAIQWGIFHGIFRLAVPFFFVCSGFFLGLKLFRVDTINQGIKEVKKYLKRLIIPYVIWLIIGLPFQLIMLKNESFIEIILKLIRKLLFYPWGALWYVWALIIAILIIIPFYKKGKVKNAMIIGGILYLFALICNNYYFIIEDTLFQKLVDTYLKIFISSRNGIFVGLYFVAAGMYIAEVISKNNKLDIWKHRVFFLVSYILFIAEIFLIKGKSLKDDNALYLMFIILIPELFVFFMRYKGNLKTSLLRSYSTGIYFMHTTIKSIIKNILIIYGISLNSYCMFILILLGCMGILTILYKIDNRYINSVIK